MEERQKDCDLRVDRWRPSRPEEFGNGMGKIGDEVRVSEDVPWESSRKLTEDRRRTGMGKMKEGKEDCDLGEDRQEWSDPEDDLEKDLRGGDLKDQEGEDGEGNLRNTKKTSATVTMPIEEKGRSIWAKELESRGAEGRVAALDPKERKSEQWDLRSRKLGPTMTMKEKKTVQYVLSRYDLGDRCAGCWCWCCAGVVVGVGVEGCWCWSRCGSSVLTSSHRNFFLCGRSFPLCGGYRY